MAEQLVMIGKPAGKIAATIGTKQINANGQQALLQDIKLCIHDAYQEACLVGNFSRSPNGAQRIRAARIRTTRVNRHARPIGMTGPSARAQASRKDANKTPANMREGWKTFARREKADGHTQHNKCGRERVPPSGNSSPYPCSVQSSSAQHLFLLRGLYQTMMPRCCFG